MSMQTGYCWASNGHLVDTLGISERTVRRALQQLQELRYVTVQEPNGASRRIHPILPLNEANNDQTVDNPPANPVKMAGGAVKMAGGAVKMAGLPGQNDRRRYQLDTNEIPMSFKTDEISSGENSSDKGKEWLKERKRLVTARSWA